MADVDESRVLLWVDDDTELLRQQRLYLEEMGFTVIAEADVDRAIEIIEKKDVEIAGIILDVMMNPGTRLRKFSHDGGLRTGLCLLQMLLEEKLIAIESGPPLCIYTHRLDPDAARNVQRMGFGYFQKQDFLGSRIRQLVKEML